MVFMNFRKIFPVCLVVVSIVLLAACKGETGNGTGTLVLSITDAPVDRAESVVVEFTGAVIQPAGGDRIDITYNDPKTIDLLALQGGLRATLLDRMDLDVGNYSWIRLKVNAVEGVRDSYIVVGGNEYELHIPSGAQNGLKLNTSFEVVEGEILDFTIDFDLRKSVHQPVGQVDSLGNPVYFLRPTLRLVETDASGMISGTVDPQLFIFTDQNCSDQEAGYAVYLYQGDVIPDDVDGIEPDPVATAAVTADNNYVYTLAFIEPGDYTIAATCMADQDGPDTDDEDVTFVGAAAVSVTAGATTPHDFLLP